MKIEAGQVWVTKDGVRVTISHNDSAYYPWKGTTEVGTWRTFDSIGRNNTEYSGQRDLFMLVTTAIVENPKFYSEKVVEEAVVSYFGTNPENFMKCLAKIADPEHAEYLRLKEKFEGNSNGK